MRVGRARARGQSRPSSIAHMRMMQEPRKSRRLEDEKRREQQEGVRSRREPVLAAQLAPPEEAARLRTCFLARRGERGISGTKSMYFVR